MTVLPEIGHRGGQEYDVARAIRSFLRQMAEGGTRVAPAVMKELIQNADDAGADVVWMVLDERIATRETSGEYSALCSPALVVGNNAPFRNASDVEGADQALRLQAKEAITI